VKPGRIYLPLDSKDGDEVKWSRAKIKVGLKILGYDLITHYFEKAMKGDATPVVCARSEPLKMAVQKTSVFKNMVRGILDAIYNKKRYREKPGSGRAIESDFLSYQLDVLLGYMTVEWEAYESAGRYLINIKLSDVFNFNKGARKGFKEELTTWGREASLAVFPITILYYVSIPEKKSKDDPYSHEFF
jgi:hypothetical protein